VTKIVDPNGGEQNAVEAARKVIDAQRYRYHQLAGTAAAQHRPDMHAVTRIHAVKVEIFAVGVINSFGDVRRRSGEPFSIGAVVKETV